MFKQFISDGPVESVHISGNQLNPFNELNSEGTVELV
jgi:hypothetical protein